MKKIKKLKIKNFKLIHFYINKNDGYTFLIKYNDIILEFYFGGEYDGLLDLDLLNESLKINEKYNLDFYFNENVINELWDLNEIYFKNLFKIKLNKYHY